MQDLAPAREIVPLGQGVQEPLSGAPEKVPAGQGTGDVVPGAPQKLPAGHALQAELPADAAKVPTRHGVQALAPAAEKDPGEHGSHCPLLPGAEPPGQPWKPTQVPLLQVSLAAQARPQLPQLFESVGKSTH